MPGNAGCCPAWRIRARASGVLAPALPTALLVSDDPPDVARLAPAVTGIALGCEIPVVMVNRLELSADRTGLPPHSVAQLTAALDPLVLKVRDELEVLQTVVLLVAVAVV